MISSIYAVSETVEVSIENDTIANTDRHYTHGTRITYSYPLNNNLFPDKDISRSWAMGQYLYTPSNIDIETMQVGDRPYAGWLYGATSISVYDNKTLDFLEINVGIIGEKSGASYTQKIIHNWSDSTEPMGWDTQLDEHVGVNLTFIKKYKWKTDYTDSIIKGNMTVGNIHVNCGAGASFRFGYNIPDDFGVVRMEPISRNIKKISVYGIVDLSQRFVTYNYFLEGDNTEEVYDIRLEKIVYDLAMGCGISYGEFNLIYLYNVRTKEFKEQKDYNEFGTIAVSFDY